MTKSVPLELKLKAHSRLARMNLDQRKAAVLRADKQLKAKWTPAAAAMSAAGDDLVYQKLAQP